MSVSKKKVSEKTMEKAEIMKKFIESRLIREIQNSFAGGKAEKSPLEAFGG